MFLKKVLHHNRIMFAGIILFILAFLYINIKWGAVATPVYTPGMFSGNMFRSDTLTAYKLYLGNREIDLAALHFSKRDMITVSLNRYSRQKQVNLVVMHLMQKVPGLGLLVNESWLNKITDSRFLEWLQSYTSPVYNDSTMLSVYRVNYIWKDRLLQLNTPQKLF